MTRLPAKITRYDDWLFYPMLLDIDSCFDIKSCWRLGAPSSRKWQPEPPRPSLVGHFQVALQTRHFGTRIQTIVRPLLTLGGVFWVEKKRIYQAKFTLLCLWLVQGRKRRFKNSVGHTFDAHMLSWIGSVSHSMIQVLAEFGGRRCRGSGWNGPKKPKKCVIFAVFSHTKRAFSVTFCMTHPRYHSIKLCNRLLGTCR